MSKKSKLNRSEAAKEREAKKGLTQRQRRFAEELVRGKHNSAGSAAVTAGYSSNNPDQSAYQALQGIKLKVPEMMDNAGISVAVLIQKHLVPKLTAKETKFFHHQGKIITRQVDALGTQMQALDTSFKLHGAYAAKDGDNAEQIGVKVIVVDIPRPRRDGVVMPDILAPVQGPADIAKFNDSNGHKPKN